MEALEPYTSVLALLSGALLLVVAAGLMKNRLVWKPKRVRVPRRRHRP